MQNDTVPTRVLFLTAIEHDIWKVLCKHDSTISIFSLPMDPDAFYRMYAEESAERKHSSETYTAALRRFIDHDLIQEITSVSRDRRFLLSVGWRKFHVVLINRRFDRYASPLFLSIIRQLEQDPIGLIENQDYIPKRVEDWIKQKFAHANAHSICTTIIGYYEGNKRCLGIIHRLHGSRRSLLCWPGFECAEFREMEVRRHRTEPARARPIELQTRDLDLMEHILRNGGHADTNTLAHMFWGSVHSDSARRRLRLLIDSKILSSAVIGTRTSNIYFVAQRGFDVLVARRPETKDLPLPNPKIVLADLRERRLLDVIETEIVDSEALRSVTGEHPTTTQLEEEMMNDEQPVETVISAWTTRCHQDHARTFLAIADGTFSGSLMKAVTWSFVKSLRRRGFLIMKGTSNDAEWTMDVAVAQTFRFTPKAEKTQLSMITEIYGEEDSRRVSTDQWRQDLEAIIAGKPIETQSVPAMAVRVKSAPPPPPFEDPSTFAEASVDRSASVEPKFILSGVEGLRMTHAADGEIVEETDDDLKLRQKDLRRRIDEAEDELERLRMEEQELSRERDLRKLKKRKAAADELERELDLVTNREQNLAKRLFEIGK